MAISRSPIIVHPEREIIRQFLPLTYMSHQALSTENVARKNVFAALLVIMGMTLISSNDAIMKLSSSEMDVGQLLFVRGSFAVLIFTLIIKMTGRPLLPRLALTRWNGLRAFCDCCATICFIIALTLLPIATVSTLAWTTPLLLTIAAAWLLNEKVSAERWIAVVVGFAGVLLVTRPFQESFTVVMLLPLASAFFVAARDLLTRKIDTGLDSIHVVWMTLTAVTAVGFIMSLGQWQPVTGVRAAWLSLSAVLLGLGFLFQVMAVRTGQLSFIAPFAYTGVITAIFFGYWIWQEWPDNLTMAGIALIVASGVYILTTGRQGQRGK